MNIGAFRQEQKYFWVLIFYIFFGYFYYLHIYIPDPDATLYCTFNILHINITAKRFSNQQIGKKK